ncbi:MAG: hypothetical protein R3E95_18075 [Thiolinea sp.]
MELILNPIIHDMIEAKKKELPDTPRCFTASAWGNSLTLPCHPPSFLHLQKKILFALHPVKSAAKPLLSAEAVRLKSFFPQFGP